MKHPKIFQNLKYFVLSASGTETSFSGMEGWLKIKLPKCLRVFKLMGCQITNKILLWLLLHFIHKKHYVLSYRYYNFSNQIIWCSVWICIACFLCHMLSLFCCAVVRIALLAVLLDRHDAITCISSAYKFKRMDADIIKMIDIF